MLVIVVVAAPAKLDLALDIARDGDSIGPWSISSAPTNALFALNAGQFTDAGPWGWVVHRQREHQVPGTGSLAGALVVDTIGRVDILDEPEIRTRRASHNVREAVQSYPTLIARNGRVPPELCNEKRGVDLTHRDTRLTVGTLATGELVVAMTRFDGLGNAAGRLPLGPTTPEMVTIMKALGAMRALMLDGGLSAQLLLRDTGGAPSREWPGLRSVPLALVATLRKE